MLDLLGIMFSSIIMFMVILRAVQLDSVLPWFKAPKTGTDSSGLKLRPADPREAQTSRRGAMRGE